MEALKIEVLRIDAYHSIRDIKKLRELRDLYTFYSENGPKEYLSSWKSTLGYCNVQLKSIGG